MDKDCLDRYRAVMSRISTSELLALPGEIKELLKSTTDLEAKVTILEEVVKRVERSKR